MPSIGHGKPAYRSAVNRVQDVQMALTWCVRPLTSALLKGSRRGRTATRKIIKSLLDECSIEIAKVVATAIGGELGKMCVYRAIASKKSQDGMAAVVLAANTRCKSRAAIVDHRANNHRSKKPMRPSCTSLTGSHSSSIDAIAVH